MSTTKTREITHTAKDRTGVHITRAQRGDLVLSGGSGDVYLVESVARVNLKCRDASGQRWNIRMFRRDGVTPSATFAPEGTLFFEEVAENAADASELVLGSVVRFARGPRANGQEYVVIGGFGPFKIAKKGGDGNRYYRGIAAAELEVVPQ